jgi:hypothetical protein
VKTTTLTPEADAHGCQSPLAHKRKFLACHQRTMKADERPYLVVFHGLAVDQPRARPPPSAADNRTRKTQQAWPHGEVEEEVGNQTFKSSYITNEAQRKESRPNTSILKRRLTALALALCTAAWRQTRPITARTWPFLTRSPHWCWPTLGKRL